MWDPLPDIDFYYLSCVQVRQKEHMVDIKDDTRWFLEKHSKPKQLKWVFLYSFEAGCWAG